MSWIGSISDAIDYIEENLEEDMEIDDIAKNAFISSSYFQKAFSLLCGFSVGEYIRNRRLANAGNDLLTTDAKILDIALKYRYDSHDSFTKAFTRFHGSTPTAVRKNGRTIKSFAPLKLNLLLKGGYIMDYRIEKTKAFSITLKIDSLNKSITYIDDDNLPEFTTFCLSAYISKELPECSSYRVDKSEKEITESFENRKIPAITWAVFKCVGTTRNEAREKTWQQICSEWLPQTKYGSISANYIFISYNTTVENYNATADDAESYDDLGEIWVAIKEK